MRPAEAPGQSKTSRVILTPAQRIDKRKATVLAELARIGIAVREVERAQYLLRRSDGRFLAMVSSDAELCRRGQQYVAAHAEALEVLQRRGLP